MISSRTWRGRLCLLSAGAAAPVDEEEDGEAEDEEGDDDDEDQQSHVQPPDVVVVLPPARGLRVCRGRTERLPGLWWGGGRHSVVARKYFKCYFVLLKIFLDTRGGRGGRRRSPRWSCRSSWLGVIVPHGGRQTGRAHCEVYVEFLGGNSEILQEIFQIKYFNLNISHRALIIQGGVGLHLYQRLVHHVHNQPHSQTVDSVGLS